MTSRALREEGKETEGEGQRGEFEERCRRWKNMQRVYTGGEKAGPATMTSRAYNKGRR